MKQHDDHHARGRQTEFIHSSGVKSPHLLLLLHHHDRHHHPPPSQFIHQFIIKRQEISWKENESTSSSYFSSDSHLTAKSLRDPKAKMCCEFRMILLFLPAIMDQTEESMLQDPFSNFYNHLLHEWSTWLSDMMVPDHHECVATWINLLSLLLFCIFSAIIQAFIHPFMNLHDYDDGDYYIVNWLCCPRRHHPEEPSILFFAQPIDDDWLLAVLLALFISSSSSPSHQTSGEEDSAKYTHLHSFIHTLLSLLYSSSSSSAAYSRND